MAKKIVSKVDVDEGEGEGDVIAKTAPVVNDLDGFSDEMQPTLFDLNAHHHKVHGSGVKDEAMNAALDAVRKAFKA